jgi:hypothetical protein
MNGNAELLNFIYQNSQMGVETIKQLLDTAEDEELKSNCNPSSMNITKSMMPPDPC